METATTNNTTSILTTNGTDISTGYADWYSTGVTSNNNYMRQVKVAVFTIKRNEDNQVVSTKMVKEMWVEQKPNTSLELIVAKELGMDFDPETTVIKEIHSFSF